MKEILEKTYPTYPKVDKEKNTVAILYIRSDAFTTCDCGKEFALHNFSGNVYSGSCLCGKKYKLIDNKLYDN